MAQSNPEPAGLKGILGCIGGALLLGILCVTFVATAARVELWLSARGQTSHAEAFAAAAAVLAVVLELSVLIAVRALILRLRGTSAAIEDAVDELLEIYRLHPEGFVRVHGGPQVKRIRRIGARLNSRGGMERMLEVHKSFAARCTVFGAPRNLEHMWDGIGEWLG